MHLNIIADLMHPFMATVFPNGVFQQDKCALPYWSLYCHLDRLYQCI